MWWLKFAIILAALWGIDRAFNEWISTRASIEYVDSETNELKKTISKHQDVVQNIRENLLILMDRQRIQPVPMPTEKEEYGKK